MTALGLTWIVMTVAFGIWRARDIADTVRDIFGGQQ